MQRRHGLVRSSHIASARALPLTPLPARPTDSRTRNGRQLPFLSPPSTRQSRFSDSEAAWLCGCAALLERPQRATTNWTETQGYATNAAFFGTQPQLKIRLKNSTASCRSDNAVMQIRRRIFDSPQRKRLDRPRATCVKSLDLQVMHVTSTNAGPEWHVAHCAFRETVARREVRWQSPFANQPHQRTEFRSRSESRIA